MSIWRPQQNILVRARGLVWRDGLLLASEIYLGDGSIKGVRPLGGRLEFGETWRDALVREFDEGLGVAVEVIGKPMVLENIFTHQGVIGHEITFVSDVIFPDVAYQQDGPIEYVEDKGETCRAFWFDVEELDCGHLELYPNGLKAQLPERTQTSQISGSLDPHSRHRKNSIQSKSLKFRFWHS